MKVTLLTPIETKVMKLLCKEMTYKEIAEELNLSPRTIESHIYRVMKRHNTKSSIGLVIMAIKHGLFKIKLKQ